MSLSRREFLKAGLLAGTGGVIGSSVKLWAFEPVDVANPLAAYPDRNWEKIYRDQYGYDSTFSWVCSPNDTHSCRCMAYVRNDVITRMGSEYNYETYADLYGNHATHNWNPRQCAKGYTFHRIVYGPYRIKHPMVRQRLEAMGGRRVSVSHARAPHQVQVRRTRPRPLSSRSTGSDSLHLHRQRAFRTSAQTYSGDRKALKRLLGRGLSSRDGRRDGWRGNAHLQVPRRDGAVGRDRQVRHVPAQQLHGPAGRQGSGRGTGGGPRWPQLSPTTPGTAIRPRGIPGVHGLQTSDCDFNDLRFSKLIIMDGKNLVENKMTDSHWFIECMERGAKIVAITPEYSRSMRPRPTTGSPSGRKPTRPCFWASRG